MNDLESHKANVKSAIPSEYKISEKWDKCFENFLLHFSAGAVAGGLTSLVLARMRMYENQMVHLLKFST